MNRLYASTRTEREVARKAAIKSRQVQGINKTNKPILDIDHTRGHHIGNSDYSKHKIQPWSIWEEYNLNGWDADIVKRVLRTKQDNSMTPQQQRILDYQKIIHNCEERIRQLNENTKPATTGAQPSKENS